MNLIDVTRTSNEDFAYQNNAREVFEELKNLKGFKDVVISQGIFLAPILHGTAQKQCYMVTVVDVNRRLTKTYHFCLLAHLANLMQKNGYTEIEPYRYRNGCFSVRLKKTEVLG